MVVPSRVRLHGHIRDKQRRHQKVKAMQRREHQYEWGYSHRRYRRGLLRRDDRPYGVALHTHKQRADRDRPA